MSTRSVISIQRAEDEYECIYCHSDGYLTYNGAMLLDHYSDREKLEKLIALGNISCLNKEVEPNPNLPHSFDYDKRQEDVVVAYGRDRGESGQESLKLSLKEMLKWDWIEYFYVYDLNGEWKYTTNEDVDFKSVKEGLDKEYKSYGIKRPKDYYGFWTDESLKAERKKQAQEEM